MKRFKFLMPIIVTLVLTSSCNNETTKQEGSNVEEATTSMDKSEGQAFVEDDVSNPNILQIAIKSADHSTLVAAVQAADLENALVNAGPLMVFAPTNEAFDNLPVGTVENLLKPENKEDGKIE